MAKPVRKLRGKQDVHLERPSATIYNHPLCFETLPSWRCQHLWSREIKNETISFDFSGTIWYFRAIYLTPSSVRQPFFQDTRITATLTRENWKYRGLGRGWPRAKCLQASMGIWVQIPGTHTKNPGVPTLLELGKHRQEHLRDSLVRYSSPLVHSRFNGR